MVRRSHGGASVVLAAALLFGGTACQRAEEQAAPQSDVVALTGARIIDGSGDAPLERGTVVIRGGIIEAFGPEAAVTIPDGARRVALDGKTIMPGLVNAHGHIQVRPGSELPVMDDLARRLRMYADYGVTTVVSLASTPADEAESVALQNANDEPGLDRARVYTSGERIVNMTTPEEARTAVDRRVDLGVSRIKFHLFGNAALGNIANTSEPDMERKVWSAIIDQAHRRGVPVAVHIFRLEDARAAVEEGVDVIAHSVRDRDVDAAFIEALRARNVGYVPTLTRELSVFTYETTPEFFADPFFQRGISLYREEVEAVSDPAYQQRVRDDEEAQSIKQALVQARENLKALVDAGVRIGLGTDSGVANSYGRWQGYFEQVELEMMVDAGMTPMQAIVAATSDAAAMSGLEHVGAIAPGRAADLLVLDANPLDDIRHTREIDSVWIAGRSLPPLAAD